MIYLEQTPNPDLRPWVRRLWYCCAPQVEHRRERVLPNGCMQIIFNLSRDYLTDCGEDGQSSRHLPQAIVVGARSRYEVVATEDMKELLGVVIQPGGFAGLFRERADLFFERFIGLHDICPSASFTDQLLHLPSPADKLRAIDLFLTRCLRPGTKRSAIVDQVMYLYRKKELSIGDCARSVGFSERRLSQVFREHVGLTPKMWCRVRRFQLALRALHSGSDVPWAELALRCGYYDQSHFANDFHAFSGINPTTYSALRGPWQNHLPIP